MQKAKVKSLSENLPRISSSGKLNLTCQGLGDRDASTVPAGARKEDAAMQQQSAVVTMMQCSSTHAHACIYT